MDHRELLWKWVQTWQDAAPELDAIRRKEIREADNRRVLLVLESAFNQAVRSLPPRSSSGMVEMQRYFARLPR